MTNYTHNKPSIGFIGLGHMGSRMAQRLLQAGYPVTIYDRNRAKMQEEAQWGAKMAENPRELATDSDIVMTSLSDNQALEEVMHSPDGVLAGVKNGSILIDTSTVFPRESRHIHDLAKAKGASMLDAAVSGSTPQAQEGSLIIFVGGEQEAYQRCEPILKTLGQAVFYMGASGMGTTMKMVINTLLGLGMQAIAEAIALGEKAGLDKRQLLDVLEQTAVIAPAHKGKLENLRQEQYPVNFALALMRKDFSLIMRLAAEASVPMPATAAAEQMYTAALAQGHNEDFSVMLQYMEELAGIPKNIVVPVH